MGLNDDDEDDDDDFTPENLQKVMREAGIIPPSEQQSAPQSKGNANAGGEKKTFLQQMMES